MKNSRTVAEMVSAAVGENVGRLTEWQKRSVRDGLRARGLVLQALETGCYRVSLPADPFAVFA